MNVGTHQYPMVFENLTLFEIQLDGSQFGPKTMSGDDTSVEDRSIDDVDHDESGGRGRLLPVFLLTVLAIGAVTLYRRSQSADVDLDVDSEEVESDLTSAQ